MIMRRIPSLPKALMYPSHSALNHFRAPHLPLLQLGVLTLSYRRLSE
jgi:hypothetical protein